MGYAYTVLYTYRIALNYMAQVFISFQQLFTLATKRDWHLLAEVLNQCFQAMNSNGSWRHLCRKSGRYCAHEIDSAVHSHRF